jgi:cold shock CspA family protein
MFRLKGKVKYFDCKKGYGFIIPENFFIADGKDGE